jgi:hypothetical protein
MVAYIKSYVDVCTGKVSADANTKKHFKEMLKLEADKITSLVLECKSKGIDVNTLCPELMNDWIEIVEALAIAESKEVTWSKSTLDCLRIIL